jgi:hypothetical protein
MKASRIAAMQAQAVQQQAKTLDELAAQVAQIAAQLTPRDLEPAELVEGPPLAHAEQVAAIGRRLNEIAIELRDRMAASDAKLDRIIEVLAQRAPQNQPPQRSR